MFVGPDSQRQAIVSLQKGINGVGKNYSVFLMSLRENTPYAGSDLFYAASLKKYGTSMMCEKEFLTS